MGHLRVGDPSHAAERRVDEDNQRAGPDAGLDAHAEEAREDHAHAAHLAGEVDEGDHDGAEDRDHPGARPSSTARHELRDRVLAVLAEVRREQDGEEHVPAGPAHEVGGAVPAREGDQPANERNDAAYIQSAAVAMPFHTGSRSPSGDVVVRGRAGLRPDRDRGVERERRDDEGPGPADRAQAHPPRSRLGLVRTDRRRVYRLVLAPPKPPARDRRSTRTPPTATAAAEIPVPRARSGATLACHDRPRDPPAQRPRPGAPRRRGAPGARRDRLRGGRDAVPRARARHGAAPPAVRGAVRAGGRRRAARRSGSTRARSTR